MKAIEERAKKILFNIMHSVNPEVYILSVLEEYEKEIAELNRAMKKFIDKVESGRARSKETYADFKKLL